MHVVFHDSILNGTRITMSYDDDDSRSMRFVANKK